MFFLVLLITLAANGEEPGSFRTGKALLKNLKILLVFWQEHYLHKDKVRSYLPTKYQHNIPSC